MDDIILRLIPEFREFETQELHLHPQSSNFSIESAISADSYYVYGDSAYYAELDGEVFKNAHGIRVYLNGNELDSYYLSEYKRIVFGHNEYDKKIFAETYGLAQLSIRVTDGDDFYYFETDFLQVLVKKSGKDDSLRRMVDYVYQNNKGFLYSDAVAIGDVAERGDISSNSLEASIRLLEQISVAYEESFRYFKANSRFTTRVEEHVDHFEKMQYVTQRTLQHIAEHPEELYRVPSSAGIRVGNERYQPSKTLITTPVKSFDIYENQVIIGFIQTLLRRTNSIIEEIEKLQANLPSKLVERDGYVSSSYFIYANAVASLRGAVKKVQMLQHSFSNLYSAYSKLFPESQVKRIKVIGTPKFTQIFRAIPQYHRIYQLIASWFLRDSFIMQEERSLLSFIKTSDLYEIYVLSKIVNFYLDEGFTLTKASKIVYSFSGNTLYKNTSCNNCFNFKNGDSSVTVFYQPVIYAEDKSELTGIGLYRNTSIVYYENADDSARTGSIYTPDYLIKYSGTENQGDVYLIADAKLSTLETVKRKQVSRLAFRYLFSVSCVRAQDRIAGLTIINGLSNCLNDGVTPVYDYSKNPYSMDPSAVIVTLTENSLSNKTIHRALLRGITGSVLLNNSFQSLPLPNNDVNEIEQLDLSIEINDDHPESIEETPIIVQPREKKKKEGTQSVYERELTSLPFRDGLGEYLEGLGYKTVADLLPNKTFADVDNIQGLNRDKRRYIKAVIKENGGRKIK